MTGHIRNRFFSLEQLKESCEMDELGDHWILGKSDGRIVLGDGRRFTMQKSALILADKPEIPGRRAYRICQHDRCCNPEHIRWFTQKQIGAHIKQTAKWKDDPARIAANRLAVLKGNHKNTIITDAQAAEIRASTETGVALAAKYGVARCTISAIKVGRRRNPPPLQSSSVFNWRPT